MFNILVDELPTQLLVGGLMYTINSDFRTVIKIYGLLENIEEDTYETLSKMLLEFYGDVYFENEIDALSGIHHFMTMNTIESCESGTTKKTESESNISFNLDGDYIYSSFQQAYNIDLTTTQMHWFKFQALLKSLPEDTIMSKILGYRQINVNDKNISPERRKFLKEMKDIYGLPQRKSSEELNQEFVDMLGM